MKTICLLLFILLFTCTINAQTWQWTHPEPNGVAITQGSYTDNKEDDYAHNVELDSAGNIYVLGDFQDSLYLNNNFITKGDGSYLAKYDSTGKLLWYRLIVPTYIPDGDYSEAIQGTGLVVNATGVYITGRYRNSDETYDCNVDTGQITQLRSYSIGGYQFNAGASDIGLFISKFNFNGGVDWNKTATASLCQNNIKSDAISVNNPLITSDKNNNLISSFICDSYDSQISFDGNVITLRQAQSGNPYYLIVMKLKPTGSLDWSAYAGGGFTGGGINRDYVDDCNSTAVDNNGNIFFYGTAMDSTYFGTYLFRTQTVTQTAQGVLATYIAKVSSTGIWQFVKNLCNNSQNTGQAGNPARLAVDNNNNIYASVLANSDGNTPEVILGDITGRMIGSSYLVKMNNAGNLIWYKRFGNQYGYSDVFSLYYNNNNLYLNGYVQTGSTEGNLLFSKLYVPPATSGGYEYLTAKADINGNFLWANTFGAPYISCYGASIKASQGNIYTAGSYQSGITTLGNLNGNFTNINASINNLFFGKLKDQYISVGEISTTTLCPGSNMTIPFTSYGLTLSGSNIFTAEISNAKGDFTTPTAIGSVASTGNGNINATIPSAFPYGSAYRIRIHSSDTLKTGFPYYAYADTTYIVTLLCPSPINELSSNITSSSAKLKWNTVACGSGYKVEHRVMGTTAWTTRNITTNTDSLVLTGLTGTTTYQWRAATTCNNGTVNYSTFSAIKTFTTTSGLMDDAFSKTSENGISIYPNPARTSVIVSFISDNPYSLLEVIDAKGQSIIQKQIATYTRKNSAEINVSRLSPGIYMLLVKTKNGVQMKEFVKE